MVNLTTIIAVGGTVGTGIGIITSFYYHQQTREMLEEKKRVQWEDLRDESRALNAQIELKFDPDIIVTPGLRGATVTNLMRDVYQSILLYNGIREDLRDTAAGLQYQPVNYVQIPDTRKYRHYLPKSLLEETDKKVLLVDAFTDTGQSLATIKNYLLDKGFSDEQVKQATVYCSKEAIADGNQPDFYGQAISRPFYFPWGKAI